MSNYDGPDDLETVQLEVTRDLIEYDHQSIVIRRPAEKKRQQDGSVSPEGPPPAPLAAQRLFFSGVTGDDVRVLDWEGQSVRCAFVLIGMPDADIKKGDSFGLWGRTFVVVDLHPDERWQRKAWVFARAR